MNNTDANHVEDVPVLETWKHLKSDPKAVLVDVRTRAEWAFMGVPDLFSLGRDVLLIEWQTFPDNRVAPDFADRLEKALTARGVQKDDEIFFICRSGGNGCGGLPPLPECSGRLRRANGCRPPPRPDRGLEV